MPRSSGILLKTCHSAWLAVYGIVSSPKTKLGLIMWACAPVVTHKVGKLVKIGV